jgi:hypothetical protein
MLIEKQISYMKKYPQLVIVIVIIVGAKANWSDRRMQHEPGGTREKYFFKIGDSFSRLIRALRQVFYGLEQITFETKFKTISNTENVAQPSGYIVE